MSVLSALAASWLLSLHPCLLGCTINTLQEEARDSGWQWRSECRGLKQLHQPQSLLGIPFVSPEERNLQLNPHLLNYTRIGMIMLKGGLALLLSTLRKERPFAVSLCTRGMLEKPLPVPLSSPTSLKEEKP